MIQYPVYFIFQIPVDTLEDTFGFDQLYLLLYCNWVICSVDYGYILMYDRFMYAFALFPAIFSKYLQAIFVHNFTSYYFLYFCLFLFLFIILSKK